MGAVGHRGLPGRYQSPGAHEGGESLMETLRNSSDSSSGGPLAPCTAFLQRMDLLLAVILHVDGKGTVEEGV